MINIYCRIIIFYVPGLLSEVSKAAEILVEHFAGSTDFFDKVSVDNARVNFSKISNTSYSVP